MSDESMRSSLDTLRTLAPKLNQLADRANILVEEVETLLSQELRVGIQMEEPFNEWESLTYERYGNRFRICVKDLRIADSDREQNVWSWSECGRELKLESVKALPALLRKLAAEVKRQMAENEKLFSDVDEIMNALGGTGLPASSTTRKTTTLTPKPTGGNDEIPF